LKPNQDTHTLDSQSKEIQKTTSGLIALAEALGRLAAKQQNARSEDEAECA
jgi:hypothetical protein